jgi:uncharacterized delta-60 repeat protein
VLLLLGLVTRAAAAPGDLDLSLAPTINAEGNPRGKVLALAMQPDGKFLIGGYLGSVNGSTRLGVARFNTDDTLDSFDLTRIGDTYGLAVQPDGKIVVGGTNFTNSPETYISRFNSDGTPDASFNVTMSGFSVQAVVLQSDGKILLSGDFNSVNGVTRNRVARLNADGTLDLGFDLNPDGRVYSIAVQTDGRILIGGSFGSFTGATTIARSGIARFNPDGTLDVGFDPNAGGGIVDSIVVQPDGKIVVGGMFTSMSGVPRNGIARLNASGTLDSRFDPNLAGVISGGSTHTEVYTLSLQTDGKILLGGYISAVGGTPRNYVARVYADGVVDTSFNPNPNFLVYGVAVQPDGKILLGGTFRTIGGTARDYLARLMNEAATQTLTVSSATRAQWLRSGAGPEVSFVTFELSTDGGATWSALGSGTRISGGWELTGLALPPSGSVRARGRTAGGYHSASAGLIEQVQAFSGLTSTLGSLSGSANYVLGSLTVGSSNTSTTYSGVLSGTGGLTKVGTGALTLSGANTYTGATTVSAGTLTVNGSLAAGTTVTVASGATLNGTGTINGNVVLQSGATLGAGLTINGTLTVSSSVAFNVNSEAALRYALFHAVAGDTIAFTGDVTLTKSLPMIGVDLIIAGGGFTLDANRTGRAFFVRAGTVSISNLTINNAVAQGGNGGAGTGGGGGGGLGAGAAVFVHTGANVTLSSVTIGNASAMGGAGGNGGGGAAGGGGGGLGGSGGATGGSGGAGGGGYEGDGGNGGSVAGGGGGGEFGLGGNSAIGGGGGGGQQGNGGKSIGTGGGGGGGATANGANAVATGGAGGGSEGGAGGSDGHAGANAVANRGGGGGGGDGRIGGNGLLSGGGGGGGQASAGGLGGIGGGGGGSANVAGGAGGAFGGGGATGNGYAVAGGQGGFGGGGGGARTTVFEQTGGAGGFGGGGGGAFNAGAGGTFGGMGGAGADADGGGGAALGGAVFVATGGTLTLTDTTFNGATYSVTAGQPAGSGAAAGATTPATAGQAKGNVMFVQDATASTTIEVGPGNTQTLAGGSDGISGAGGLTKTGAGTLVLSGDNTYTGATTVTAGTLQIGTGGTSGSVAGNISNNAAVVFNRSDNITFAGVISGTGTLTKQGGGVLTLSGANTFSGATTVSAGTLRLAGAGTLGSGVLTFAAGASLDLNGVNTSLPELSGGFGVALGTATLSVGTNNASTTYSGVISGTGGLTKLGTGTLTLSGANTFSGGTTVSAGTLVVNGAISAPSTVSVQTNATLSGTGTIGAGLVVGDNAVLAPGSGGIGTLSIAHMTWHGSSTGGTTARFELGAAGASDRLAVTDFFNKGTGTTFRFDFGGTGAVGTYTLATFASTTFAASDFSYVNLTPGLGGTFSIVGGTTLVFEVAAAPVINSAVARSGTYGSPFTYTITATNSPTTFSVTGTLPAGLALGSGTAVISGTPTESGTFNVTLGAANAGGSDTESLAITIAPVTVRPVVTAAAKIYDGTSAATIATRSLTGVIGADVVTLIGGTATFADAAVGTGKTVTVTGLTLGGAAASNYVLSSTSATTTATITAASVAVTVQDPSPTYDGGPKRAVVSVSPAVAFTTRYNGSTVLPTNAGTYAVNVTLLDANYSGGGSGVLTIRKAGATMSLANLTQTFDGTPRSVTATTTPAGLPVVLTYNGVSAAPTAAGTYAVVATIDAPNHTGSASGTLIIAGTGPSITMQPASESVTAGANVTFSVVASENGGGTLRYQWFFNGTPLAGATSATLALDAVRAAQAGAYSVVVTNDLGNVTSASATLSVQAGAHAGVYLGTLGGGTGSFALTIRPDGTGTALLYVVGTKAGYTVAVTIDGDGAFTGIATPLVRPTSGAAGDIVVSGRIVDGVVSGSTGPLGLAMAGAANTGSLPFAGIFNASTTGAAPIVVNASVGPGGQMLVLVSGGGVTNFGTGTISAGGAFTIATGEGGPVVSGTLSDNGTVSGTVSQGGVTTPFLGVLEGAEAIRRLGNLATRGFGGAGDNVMIVGFAIGGTAPKQVLIRGVGPALAQFGVSGFLTQPALELFQGTVRLAANTGWGTAGNATEIATAAAASGAFAFAAASADSAILTTLNPGSYTAIVRGANGNTGVSLVEVYEVGAGAGARLVNLATRGAVGADTNQLIAGLYVAGNAPKRLLIRGVGPGLAGFGVPGALDNPQVQVVQGTSVVATNDDWNNDAAVAAAATASGAFALAPGSRDAALLVTLAPGAYTVVVSGVGNTSGIALVEVYEVP